MCHMDDLLLMVLNKTGLATLLNLENKPMQLFWKPMQGSPPQT